MEWKLNLIQQVWKYQVHNYKLQITCGFEQFGLNVEAIPAVHIQALYSAYRTR